LYEFFWAANYLDVRRVLHLLWDVLFWRLEGTILEILKKKNFKFKPKYLFPDCSESKNFKCLTMISDPDEWPDRKVSKLFTHPVWVQDIWERLWKTNEGFSEIFQTLVGTREDVLEWMEGIPTIWDVKMMEDRCLARKKYLFSGKDEVLREFQSEAAVIDYLSHGDFLEAEMAFRDKYKIEIDEFIASKPYQPH
jgi:hypothetical protein